MSLTGSCHCGETAFAIDGEIPDKLTRCTCSFCAKRGHRYAYSTPQQFKMTKGDGGAVYRWHTKLVAPAFLADLWLRHLQRQPGVRQGRQLGRQDPADRD